MNKKIIIDIKDNQIDACWKRSSLSSNNLNKSFIFSEKGLKKLIRWVNKIEVTSFPLAGVEILIKNHNEPHQNLENFLNLHNIRYKFYQ